MARINKTADGRNQQLVLEYLENNASDVLVEKINSGTRTIADCWRFITGKARSRAVSGSGTGSCAVISDEEVFGWAVHFFEESSEELKKEDPFGPGAWKAWRAVRWNEGDELEIDDSCWPKEYEGFVKTLREFGCKTFLVTNQSSGLMRDIFGYIDNGCRLVGPELIAKVENRYGTMATVNHEALRFEIN